jgi:hypothetical protein
VEPFFALATDAVASIPPTGTVVRHQVNDDDPIMADEPVVNQNI